MEKKTLQENKSKNKNKKKLKKVKDSLEIKFYYETLSLNDLSNLVLNITKTIKTKPIAV